MKQLTARERILIVILLFLVIAGGGYRYILQPAINEREAAQEDLKNVTYSREDMQKKLTELAGIPDRLEEEKARPAEWKDFLLKKLSDTDTDRSLQSSAKAAGVEITSFAVTPQDTVVSLKYQETEKKAVQTAKETQDAAGETEAGAENGTETEAEAGTETKTEAAADSNGVKPHYDCTLEVSGDREAIMKMIDQISASGNSECVTGFSILPDPENKTLSKGTVNVRFYYLAE